MQPAEKTGQLRPQIGLLSAIVFVISAVIGTGVFKKAAPMAAELGSPLYVMLAWALAGFISLAGTLSNAEVASLLADSGGEYAYFRTIYNRFFAFLLGWANFAVIRTASIASIAYVFAQSLHSIVPFPEIGTSLASVHLLGLYPFDNLSVKAVAIALVLLLTGLNVLGIRTGELVSRTLTALMLLAMLAIIVFGLASPVGTWAGFARPPATAETTPLLSALALACLSAFWAYEGWNNVGFIGGEIKNPQRNLPLALTIGTILIMSLYLLINLVYLYVLPIEDLVQIFRGKNDIAAVAAVRRFWGAAGGLGISLLLLVTTFNCTNSTILMASRLFYAMARDGLFFRSAARLHPRYNTPANALLMQGLWAAVLVLSGTFDQLTDMLIFASFIFYGATTLGVFVLRRRWPDVPRPYRVIGYPVVPGLFLVFCTGLLLNTLLNRPEEALIGLGLMATGLPFYLLWAGAKE